MSLSKTSIQNPKMEVETQPYQSKMRHSFDVVSWWIVVSTSQVSSSESISLCSFAPSLAVIYVWPSLLSHAEVALSLSRWPF